MARRGERGKEAEERGWMEGKGTGDGCWNGLEGAERGKGKGRGGDWRGKGGG